MGVGHEGRVKIYNAEIVIMESARGPQKLCFEQKFWGRLADSIMTISAL